MEHEFDLNTLRLFVEVADSQGFSAAARKLRMQRSSVSRAVAGLEDRLGVQLFSRTTRQVGLTSAGTAFYEQVAPRLSSLLQAVRTMPELEAEPSGKLRLSTSMDIGAVALPAALAGFSRRYPKVQVEVLITNRFVDLVAEGIDATVRPGPRDLEGPAPVGREGRPRWDASLAVHRLREIRGNVYASPTYLARRGRPRNLDEAQSHDWIDGPGPRVCPPDPAVVVDEMLCALGCCREGLGLAGLPDFVARDDVHAGRLVPVFEPEEAWTGALYFMHPKAERLPRKLVALRSSLLEFFGQTCPVDEPPLPT